MTNFALTTIVAVIFGAILMKLKVPGGLLIGSLIAVSAFNATTSSALMPMEAKVIAQIVTGAYVGSNIKKEDVLGAKKLIMPIIFLMLTFLAFSTISGVVLSTLGYMDMKTAMFCTLPGGVSETPLIAAELGADSAIVAVVQFSRLIAGIAIFPPLIVWTTKNEKNNLSLQETPKTATTENFSPKALVLTLSIAFACGIIGELSGFPAGSIVFSMLGTITAKLLGAKLSMHISLRRAAQIFSGAYIGSSVTMGDIAGLKNLFVPIAFILGGYFLISLLMGFAMKRFWGLSRSEAMLSATPAGASDMALIAADLGVDSANLVVIQVFRLVLAISVFPTVILWIEALLSPFL